MVQYIKKHNTRYEPGKQNISLMEKIIKLQRMERKENINIEKIKDRTTVTEQGSSITKLQ